MDLIEYYFLFVISQTFKMQKRMDYEHIFFKQEKLHSFGDL